MTSTDNTLPPGVAAVWGAFLFEGLFISSKQPNRADQIRSAWGLGQIELVTECCETYLPVVWEQVKDRWHGGNFPGVFEYEVISELGKLLGDYLIEFDRLPESNKVFDIIRDLVQVFFGRDKAASNA